MELEFVRNTELNPLRVPRPMRPRSKKESTPEEKAAWWDHQHKTMGLIIEKQKSELLTYKTLLVLHNVYYNSEVPIRIWSPEFFHAFEEIIEGVSPKDLHIQHIDKQTLLTELKRCSIIP